MYVMYVKYQTSIERNIYFFSCSKHMAHHTVCTEVALPVSTHLMLSYNKQHYILCTRNTHSCTAHTMDELRTKEGSAGLKICLPAQIYKSFT